MKKEYLLSTCLLASVLMITACGGEENQEAGANSTDQTSQTEGNDGGKDESEDSSDREDWPDPFVYGILPAEDQQVLSNRYEPLEEYLENELGVEVEFFQGTDYNAMIEAMRNGHIHATHYGPFSYILAADRGNAEAFAMGVESEDEATYQSYIVTLEDNGIEELEDLEGADFAWVDAASTSGHLFPKGHIINELGLSAEEVDNMFANTIFAGGHDTALLALLNGDVDAAGVGDFIVERISDTHGDHDNLDQVKVIAETDDIPRGPDAIHAICRKVLRKRWLKRSTLCIKIHPWKNLWRNLIIKADFYL
ncbi:phosphate/phosphite/phosphonate ABC transporter substrate-binding protein [Thalassobacillus sp. C254]|uniref:phosphate/phosphite/phosphonate ABC transporter substrate-binding protein n=1 Tax=Thalassobacillus sp. C254 TaxID=1225341 RepID=UPI0006D03DFA|nr:phosphate/phosphite/phosphonate ABC transporter substrate-binding protein [Thalassobacillus sp. C254]